MGKDSERTIVRSRPIFPIGRQIVRMLQTFAEVLEHRQLAEMRAGRRAATPEALTA